MLQDPSAALNPVFTVGDQIIETLLAHRIMPKPEARARLLELLDAVRIPDADQRADEYPHQLSGGLRQRVMIALGLADEPTTGLDATTQSQIVELLRDLVEYHDLAVVDACADRVAVVRAGRLVETAATDALFAAPQHPYTQRLLAATDLSSRLPHDPGEPPPDDHDTPLREVVAGHWARI